MSVEHTYKHIFIHTCPCTSVQRNTNSIYELMLLFTCYSESDGVCDDWLGLIKSGLDVLLIFTSIANVCTFDKSTIGYKKEF